MKKIRPEEMMGVGFWATKRVIRTKKGAAK